MLYDPCFTRPELLALTGVTEAQLSNFARRGVLPGLPSALNFEAWARRKKLIDGPMPWPSGFSEECDQHDDEAERILGRRRYSRSDVLALKLMTTLAQDFGVRLELACDMADGMMQVIGDLSPEKRAAPKLHAFAALWLDPAENSLELYRWCVAGSITDIILASAKEAGERDVVGYICLDISSAWTALHDRAAELGVDFPKTPL